MESYQFSSTYTVISGILGDVDSSKGQNFELSHCCSKQAISYAIELGTKAHKKLRYNFANSN